MTNFKFQIVLIIAISAIITGSAVKSFAQSVEIGGRLMPTVSTLRINSSEGGTLKGEATLGFGAGVFIGFMLSDHVGIQVEAIYTSLNQKFQEKDEERKINLRYFNVPLLVTLNSGKSKTVNFSLVAGPQLGFSAGSSISTISNNNPDDAEPVLSIKKGDFGFAYGAGVDFALDSDKKIRLGVGYRGVLGLVDISDDSISASNNTYYVLEKTTVKTHSA